MDALFSGARQTKGNVTIPPRPVNKGKATVSAGAKKTTSASGLPPPKKPAQFREQSLDYLDEPLPSKSTQARRRPRSPDPHGANDPPAKRPHHSSKAQSDNRVLPKPSMNDSPEASDDEPTHDTPPQPSAWITLMSKLSVQSTVEQRKLHGYQRWYDAARETVRNVGHFVRFERVIRNGLKHYQTPLKDQPWTKSQRYDAHVEDVLIFQILIKRFEGLEDHVAELCRYPDVVKKIAAFLDSVLSKTRSDDLARLNLNLFAHIEGVSDSLIYKEICGFKDVILSRELLPPEYLEKFDEDPDRFRARIEQGKIFFKSGCLPSFIIDLDKYNPNEPLEGFLQGQTLQNVAIILIYNGPRALASSRANHGKAKKSQRSIAKKYGVTELTTEAVIYVAGLVRHVLCTPLDWNEKDGEYDIDQMTQKIRNMCLRNPSRIRTIMASYSRTLFGTPDVGGNTVDEDVENNTTYARMMAWEGNEIADEPGALYNALLRRTAPNAPVEDHSENVRDLSPDAPSAGSPHAQDDEQEYAAAEDTDPAGSPAGAVADTHE